MKGFVLLKWLNFLQRGQHQQSAGHEGDAAPGLVATNQLVLPYTLTWNLAQIGHTEHLVVWRSGVLSHLGPNPALGRST